MTKIAGSESGSGSIGQRHGSADPDPPYNVMDPQHCFISNNRHLLLHIQRIFFGCFYFLLIPKIPKLLIRNFIIFNNKLYMANPVLAWTDLFWIGMTIKA
jgi:hypothetical protein